LIVAAQQAGWLNAVIELKNDKSERPQESRAKQYRDAGKPAPYVELDAGGIFLEILMEAGPVKTSPMGGYMALDWVDLASYAALTLERVEPWEASLLRRMSQAYAAGLEEGKSPFSIAPADR